MYKRIVVGTDGSAGAQDAVLCAGQLAHALGLDEVHVVAAFRPFTVNEMTGIQRTLPPDLRDAITPDLDANNCIAQADAILRRSRVHAVPHATSGDPAANIRRVASLIDADLVVVGTHNRRVIERIVHRSVSAKLDRHASYDLLVVDHDHRADAPTPPMSTADDHAAFQTPPSGHRWPHLSSIFERGRRRSHVRSR